MSALLLVLLAFVNAAYPQPHRSWWLGLSVVLQGATVLWLPLVLAAVYGSFATGQAVWEQEEGCPRWRAAFLGHALILTLLVLAKGLR